MLRFSVTWGFQGFTICCFVMGWEITFLSSFGGGKENLMAAWGLWLEGRIAESVSKKLYVSSITSLAFVLMGKCN